MAATAAPHFLQLPARSPELRVLISCGYAIFRSRLEFPFSRKNYATPLRARKLRVECVAKSTELEALVKDGGDDDNEDDDEVRENDDKVVAHGDSVNGSVSSQRNVSASGGDSLSLGIREPVYEVLNFIDHLVILHNFGCQLFCIRNFAYNSKLSIICKN